MRITARVVDRASEGIEHAAINAMPLVPAERFVHPLGIATAELRRIVDADIPQNAAPGSGQRRESSAKYPRIRLLIAFSFASSGT